MGTGKIRSVYRLIRSKGHILITVDNTGVTRAINVARPLEEVFMLAIASKRLYNELNEDITEQATEQGELRTLEALRKATDKI